MAISIINEPNIIYPAYNDSYIEFTSSLTGTTKAVIQLEPSATFPKPFEIYPNLNGRFLFNLKEPVKSRFNTNGFEDIYYIYPTGWSKNIENTYLTQTINITDYGVETTGTTLNRTYEFYKSVKQVGEPVHNNPNQILNNSINGIDYNISYYEGYPFSFELQRVGDGDAIKVYNRNTSIFSNNLISDSNSTFRIYIDKVTTNWTTSNFLPLQDDLNKLEIYNTGVLTTNLNLKKVPAKCGVFLKWFNDNGGYSYFLFDEFYNSNTSNKTIDEVTRNDFNNVNNGLKSPNKIIGKQANESLTVKATVDKNEVEHLRSLFTSPSVQLYTSQSPFIEGEFIDVTISGSHNYFTKKALNEVKIKINLPEQITLSL